MSVSISITGKPSAGGASFPNITDDDVNNIVTIFGNLFKVNGGTLQVSTSGTFIQERAAIGTAAHILGIDTTTGFINIQASGSNTNITIVFTAQGNGKIAMLSPLEIDNNIVVNTTSVAGVVTLAAGVATVSFVSVNASSMIFLTAQNSSGAINAALEVTNRVNDPVFGGFDIQSANALDDRPVAYLIIQTDL